MPDRVLAIANALLEAVEMLPAEASGAFVVTRAGVDLGMVVAERRRVCWATAVGLEHRLRQLMVLHAGKRVSRDALLATPGIAAALRQHSVESLIELCGPDASVIRWIPRERPLEAPNAYSPTELLAAMGARLYANEAATARGMLEGTGAAGGSYAIGDGDELAVVHELAGDRLGVTSLLALGDWAAAALDATPGFTPAMIERAVFGVQRSVALGWRSARRLVHAVIIEDRTTLDHAVRSLRDQRMPAVVSICVPWKLSNP